MRTTRTTTLRRSSLRLALSAPLALLALGVPACGSTESPASSPPESAAAGASQPSAKLVRHVLPVTANLTPVGRLPADRRLRLTLGLPLRDAAGLDRLLQDLYDPSSPRYRKFLSPSEFAAQFAPLESEYAEVIAYATERGLEVKETYPDRTLVTVEASAGDVERAFHTVLGEYRLPGEATTFYAPQVEPSLDRHVPLLQIVGLDDFLASRPLAPRPERATARPRPQAGGGQSGWYNAADLRAAYAPGVSLNGAGQKVGIYNPPHGLAVSDVTAFEDRNQLPHALIEKIFVDGGGDAPPDGFSIEVTGDVEMAIAMAPGLDAVLVYQGDMLAAFKRAASDNVVKQFSSSWPSAPQGGSWDQIYQQFAAQGQSFFYASGDDGAWFPTIPQKEDDPWLTIVGGTTLTTAGPGGAWSSESCWKASGGGVLGNYGLPGWQQGISMAANHGSTSYRNSPDVSAVAWDIEDVYQGSPQWVGGTSMASPIWAGFMALVNQQASMLSRPPVGLLNPSIYAIGKSSAYQGAIHDITTGDNTRSDNPNPDGANQYFAVPGYDLCTGWGSPVGQPLIDQLVGYPALPWSGQWASYGMPPVTQIAAGMGPDLRLVAFGITSSNASIAMDPQAVVNGGWSAPSSLGGSQIHNMAVGRNADGRLEVFAIGGDNALWHNWQLDGSNWSGWSSLGGWGLRQVTVAREADGRLRAFVLGGDRNVYSIAELSTAGGWGSYINLGGAPLQQIVAGTDPNGAIEVVGLGTNGATMVATETGPSTSAWSRFSSLGGWASQLAVGKNADGRIEIYQLGASGAVNHQWRTPSGAWSGWVSLGAAGRDLAVGNELNGSLDVFIVGFDGAIYGIDQNGPNGGWSGGWPQLGVGPFSHVAVATNANGHLELLGLTTSGDLQHTWQNIPGNL